MSSLNNLYIKLDTLKTLVKVLEQKKENGISIDLSINDDVNEYGQNINAYVSQPKEDREALIKCKKMNFINKFTHKYLLLLI